MSTPFAQIEGSATERIGGDQSWPLHAGPTTHLPPHDANAATQVVQPLNANAATQVVQPLDANAATQVVQPQYQQPQYAQPQYVQPQYVQPQYVQPQYVQPQYAQPQPADQAYDYYGGPQQPGPLYPEPQYFDQQYVDQQYPGQQYPGQQYPDQQYPGHQYAATQFSQPAYGTPQVWQIEEETERFVDHPAAFVPPPAAVAEHSARRRRNVWISLLTGVTVASAVLVSGFFVLGRLSDAPASAVVGDCLARSGEGAVVVPCSDQRAAFTVLGRLDSRTQIEASMSACTAFSGTTDVYWQGKEGVDARGLVLCLGPAKK
jgi:hypothetical protein